MTAVLVVLTILVAVVIDVLIVARRRQRVPVRQAARPDAVRVPVIPQGIFLGPSHAWARLTAEGSLRVGVDDLLAQAVGEVDAVVPVASGAEIERGDTVVSLRIGERTLDVKSPVAGRIAEVNENLRHQPWLVARDPYGAGWAVSLRSRDLKEALRPLRVGGGAAAYLREEMGRLVDFLVRQSAPQMAPALADGGAPRVGALRQLDDEGWKAFQNEFCSREEV